MPKIHVIAMMQSGENSNIHSIIHLHKSMMTNHYMIRREPSRFLAVSGGSHQ